MADTGAAFSVSFIGSGSATTMGIWEYGVRDNFRHWMAVPTSGRPWKALKLSVTPFFRHPEVR
jgi:hypothetical protein